MATTTPRLTPGQRRATTFAAAGGFIDGYDLLVLSAALLVITPYFDLSAGQVGALVAAAYIGSWLGTLVFGYYTDRFGRRAVFVLNMVVFIATSVFCALSPTFVTLLIARFFVGVAIGMDLPTAGAMIAEFASPARRGRLLAVWQLLWAIGAVIAPVVALAFLPLGDDSWRFMLVSGAIPALIVLFGRRSVPETPRWLLSQGREDEARTALEWAGQDPAELDDLRPSGGTAQRQTTLGASVRAMFHPDHRRHVILMCVACFAGAFGPLFLGSYVSYLAKYYGFTSDVQALLFGGIVWVFYIIGNVVNISLTDRVGRKPLLITGAALVTLTLVVASQIDVAGNVGLVIMVFAIAALGHWGGVDQGLWQYSTELFPTHIRATARGFTTSWIRLSAFVSSLVTPVMLAKLGFGTTMLIFAAVELVLLFVAFALPEVKGRELEDIGETAQPSSAASTPSKSVEGEA